MTGASFQTGSTCVLTCLLHITSSGYKMEGSELFQLDEVRSFLQVDGLLGQELLSMWQTAGLCLSLAADKQRIDTPLVHNASAPEIILFLYTVNTQKASLICWTSSDSRFPHKLCIMHIRCTYVCNTCMEQHLTLCLIVFKVLQAKN